MDVMASDKLRFPPSTKVQMLEAPPPGDTPVKNMPRRRAAATSSPSGPDGKIRKPNAKDI